MNLIVSEEKSNHAQSAIYLLKKYAKNKKDNTYYFNVSFLDDIRCYGDGYRIEIDRKNIFVYAKTAVGFNAATGYLIRHQELEIKNQIVTFDSDFRAVYFANHFYNYYHAAPVEELCEYLESLALWGQNALVLWFDMHHFKGISMPDAEQMLKKMICLYKKAKSLGMKTALTRLSNEYYVDVAPRTLLAENTTNGGRYHTKLCGFYHTEICPSKPEGKALLLSSFDDLMTKLESIGLDYIMLWPYDQGGCTCERCYPWGANGFYKIAKRQAEIAKKHFPDIEIILSCWRFDHFTNGEWERIIPLIKEDGDWIDRLMVDIGSAHLPENLVSVNKNIVSFPEISMYHATPWGGFGANPFPQALSSKFQKVKSFCHGGAIYSEGIFEDINKAVALACMQDPMKNPEHTVFEYCAYHFGSEYADALTDIIMRLENTLKRTTILPNGEKGEYAVGKPQALYSYRIQNKELVEEIAQEFLIIHKKIPTTVKQNWRYRQLFARIVGDATLVKNNGIPDEESDAIFSKLIPIYHAEQAYYFVCPVTRDSIMENRGEGI